MSEAIATATSTEILNFQRFLTLTQLFGFFRLYKSDDFFR